MKHPVFALFLACGLSFLLTPHVVAQTATIRYLDRVKKAEVTIEGEIQTESPSAITYKIKSGKPDKISVLDLVEITYKAPGGVSAIDYRKPFNKSDEAFKATNDDTRKKAVEDSLALFQEMLPRLAEAPAVLRQAQFRICQLQSLDAEYDPTQVDPAIASLQKFLDKNSEGWQVVPATKALAGLQEKKGDVAGAQKTYETLAARDDIPKETRQECDLLVARALIDANKFEVAERKLTAVAKSLPPDDPQGQRVDVYLAACQIAGGKLPEAEKKLQEILAKTSDEDVKALAYNTLGDCLQKQGHPEEAFWQYLWVDVKYNQDKAEHARALFHLARLFEQLKKDDLRSKQCREKLLKDKQYAGTEYQKRAMREEKN